MAGDVLIDASVVIGLARVEGLAWLPPLFGTVWIPREVRDEVMPPPMFDEAAIIESAFDQGWLRLAEPTPGTPELPDLDEGETACIRLALAGRQPALVLMDERAGRAIARELGLQVAGTAAVIGQAKQRGLIPSARAVFERLHASDFRISATVINTILRQVDEYEKPRFYDPV